MCLRELRSFILWWSGELIVVNNNDGKSAEEIEYSIQRVMSITAIHVIVCFFFLGGNDGKIRHYTL